MLGPQFPLFGKGEEAGPYWRGCVTGVGFELMLFRTSCLTLYLWIKM